eukprot:GHVQ01024935.1.p1 GENE.GHVQ01024935.1~~GHVQ01024935.1.p1  ORF type:complete len:741 (-),score=77.07 GHVQ01024935.1:213-2435(-)
MPNIFTSGNPSYRTSVPASIIQQDDPNITAYGNHQIKPASLPPHPARPIPTPIRDSTSYRSHCGRSIADSSAACPSYLSMCSGRDETPDLSGWGHPITPFSTAVPQDPPPPFDPVPRWNHPQVHDLSLPVPQLQLPSLSDSLLEAVSGLLGIHPAAEPHFLWIAHRAALAPLPDAWQEIEDDVGGLAYYHKQLQKLQKVHPLVERFTKLYEKHKRYVNESQDPRNRPTNTPYLALKTIFLEGLHRVRDGGVPAVTPGSLERMAVVCRVQTMSQISLTRFLKSAMENAVEKHLVLEPVLAAFTQRTGLQRKSLAPCGARRVNLGEDADKTDSEPVRGKLMSPSSRAADDLVGSWPLCDTMSAAESYEQPVDFSVDRSVIDLMETVREQQVKEDVFDQPEPLVTCSECECRASRVKCVQCQDFFCNTCFPLLHQQGRRSEHFSVPVLQSVCVHCDNHLAQCYCVQCGMSGFCNACFDLIHRKDVCNITQEQLTCGTKQNSANSFCTNNMDAVELEMLRYHIKLPLEGLKCLECEGRKANVICDDCVEFFCEECFIKLHRKGKRRYHSYLEIDDNFKVARGNQPVDLKDTYEAIEQAKDNALGEGEREPWLAFRDNNLDTFWYNLRTKKSSRVNVFNSCRPSPQKNRDTWLLYDERDLDRCSVDARSGGQQDDRGYVEREAGNSTFHGTDDWRDNSGGARDIAKSTGICTEGYDARVEEKRRNLVELQSGGDCPVVSRHVGRS